LIGVTRQSRHSTIRILLISFIPFPSSHVKHQIKGERLLLTHVNSDYSLQTTTVLDLHGFTTFTDMSDAMSWWATNTKVIGVQDTLGVWHDAAYSTIPNVVTTYTVVYNLCSPALYAHTRWANGTRNEKNLLCLLCLSLEDRLQRRPSWE